VPRIGISRPPQDRQEAGTDEDGSHWMPTKETIPSSDLTFQPGPHRREAYAGQVTSGSQTVDHAGSYSSDEWMSLRISSGR
jgi:hypothetical protein